MEQSNNQSEMDKLTFALESFKNIQDLIKFVDQKSGAFLVVTGLIFTGFVQFINGLIFIRPENITFFSVIAFFSGLSTFVCLIFVVCLNIFGVLKPRKAKDYQKGESSLFYYEHIFNNGKDQILTKYEGIDEKSMLKDILHQQHEISGILINKTTKLNTSLYWLFASVVSVSVFIISSNQL